MTSYVSALVFAGWSNDVALFGPSYQISNGPAFFSYSFFFPDVSRVFLASVSLYLTFYLDQITATKITHDHGTVRHRIERSQPVSSGEADARSQRWPQCEGEWRR